MKDLLPLTRRQNGLIIPDPFPYFDIILILLLIIVNQDHTNSEVHIVSVSALNVGYSLLITKMGWSLSRKLL